MGRVTLWAYRASDPPASAWRAARRRANNQRASHATAPPWVAWHVQARVKRRAGPRCPKARRARPERAAPPPPCSAGRTEHGAGRGAPERDAARGGGRVQRTVERRPGLPAPAPVWSPPWGSRSCSGWWWVVALPRNALRISCGRLAGGREDALIEPPSDDRWRANATNSLLAPAQQLHARVRLPLISRVAGNGHEPTLSTFPALRLRPPDRAPSAPPHPQNSPIRNRSA